MPSTNCPNCDTRVFIGSKAEEGDIFLCPGCDIDLELVWVDPPELAFYWDYDEDETVLYDDVEADLES